MGAHPTELPRTVRFMVIQLINLGDSITGKSIFSVKFKKNMNRYKTKVLKRKLCDRLHAQYFIIAQITSILSGLLGSMSLFRTVSNISYYTEPK